MMKLSPKNGTVICETAVPEEHSAEENGIAFNKRELPLYKILSIGQLDSKMLPLTSGDIIAVYGSPAKVQVSLDKVQYIIKEENIAAVIV